MLPRLPRWLYERREYDDGHLRTRRYGSRRPLGVVLIVIDGDPTMAASWIFALGREGRLSLSGGPVQGILAGLAELPEGTRERWWNRGNGLAIVLALAPKGAV